MGGGKSSCIIKKICFIRAKIFQTAKNLIFTQKYESNLLQHSLTLCKKVFLVNSMAKIKGEGKEGKVTENIYSISVNMPLNFQTLLFKLPFCLMTEL